MRQDILKQLAKGCATGNISKVTTEFILNKLANSDLKIFTRFLRGELEKQRVYVTTSSQMTTATKKTLGFAYKGKEIIEIIDSTVGAGIKIQENDSIIDFTFKRYINDTINKLKE